MDDLTKYMHMPVEFLWGILAVGGGMARYLNSFVNGAPFSFGLLAASAFVAGFSGYMFALLGKSLQVGPETLYVMAGVGGFFGEQTMKLIYEYYSKQKMPPLIEKK